MAKGNAIHSTAVLPPRYAPKTCEICGEHYYRRNYIEVWDIRNPGGRIGWHKSKVKVCNNCMNPVKAQRMVATLGMQIRVKTIIPEEAKKALPPKKEDKEE